MAAKINSKPHESQANAYRERKIFRDVIHFIKIAKKKKQH